jgi:predicted lipoprotein
MKINKLYIIFGLFLLWGMIVFNACQNSNNEMDKPTFDRKAMLQDYAEKIIKPAFTDLQTQVNALKTATDNFVNTTNSANLTALQNAWTVAYSSWQYANGFNFGPAGEEGIRKGLIEEIGTFPTSSTKIDTYINAGNASLNNFDRDSRGFLGLEYLIFDLGGNSESIISKFQSQNRKNYLSALANHLKTRVDNVVSAWGSYTNEFVNNNGTDVGSATSMLYNEFVRSYESIKNFKVGLPAGFRPGQTQTEPQRVEAYYSGKTLEMMKLHLKSVEEIWYGRTKNGQEIIGFKKYLESVEGGKALINSTEAQLANVKNTLNQVPTNPNFATLVQNKNVTVTNLHTELQKHTRFFKSDMSSLLGIAITFSSGDGD